MLNFTNAPLVSVVMGTYNGEKYLGLAIESILNQSFRDFELIVVDDGSTDGTPGILAGIKDARLRTIRNQNNIGIAGTLNRAIEHSTGRYIAIQDHDDISLPERLLLQSHFLDRHAEVGMVGSSCRIIDASGTLIREVTVKDDDAVLRWALLWYNPFFHTTLMIRRNVLNEIGGYSCDAAYRFAEDFEMMSRVAMGHAVANIRQPLGCWRTHATSATALSLEQQLDAAATICFRNFCELWQRSGKQLPPDARTLYAGMWSFQFPRANETSPVSNQQIASAPRHLRRLECAFSRDTPGLKPAARIRAGRYWLWGKHAAALCLRQRWGSRLRVGLLVDAVGLLSYGGGLLVGRKS